ncbi:carbonic anhydrase [Leptolyngbya sp. AN02str]|uniref:carbonic anhydrase n=1 Tax=Leptolyngbya sp. AN02str TaxID=3423363 RepID=UPI003D313CAE
MDRRRLLKLGAAQVLGMALHGAIARSALAQQSELIWDYVGTNEPSAWGTLSPDFATCAIGHAQSPINLTDGTPHDSVPLEIHYTDSPLRLLNTGRTIQVNYEPGSFITLNGETLHLLQFHFHHPSEHRIKGKPADMELHLLHRSDAGKLAVVGVMLQAGKPNATLQPIWDRLPDVLGVEQVNRELRVDARELLPGDRHFFSYSGSLTTPPCTEGVTWLVMQQSVELSKAQIERFAALYPRNARPIQR